MLALTKSASHLQEMNLQDNVMMDYQFAQIVVVVPYLVVQLNQLDFYYSSAIRNGTNG